jgi:hypothetical protein
MAEERTLGLARAQDLTDEEPSKQELQRRLDEARDSISHTVTEIKESVANQVQAVKETLDWREQFKKRPVVWSAGAAGVGFLVGYGLAAMAKGNGGVDDADYGYDRYGYGEQTRSYAAQPVLQASASAAGASKLGNGKHDEGPGLLEKLSHTHAYQKVKDEAGNLGDAFVQEITQTAKQVVLPALMVSLRNFIGGYLPNAPTTANQQSGTSNMGAETDRARSTPASNYQPALERNQG